MKINAICKTPDPEGRRKVLQAIYNRCGSVEKAARKCQVDKGTFSRWCTKYGVKTDRTRKTSRVIDWNGMAEYKGFSSVGKMIRYYLDNYHYSEIYIALGVSYPTLRYQAKKLRMGKKKRVNRSTFTIMGQG